MNVYAGERSPPSRNQVISVPKRRPPRPHSSRWSRSALRQRPATKPSTVTSRKKNAKTARATPSIPCTGRSPRPEVHDPRQKRRERHPEQLVPVEEREPQELRLDRRVQGRPQQSHDGDEQEQVPPARRAAGPPAAQARITGGG